MTAFDFEKYYFPEYYSITHTDNKNRRVNLEAVAIKRFFKHRCLSERLLKSLKNACEGVLMITFFSNMKIFSDYCQFFDSFKNLSKPQKKEGQNPACTILN